MQFRSAIDLLGRHPSAKGLLIDIHKMNLPKFAQELGEIDIVTVACAEQADPCPWLLSQRFKQPHDIPAMRRVALPPDPGRMNCVRGRSNLPVLTLHARILTRADAKLIRIRNCHQMNTFTRRFHTPAVPITYACRDAPPPVNEPCTAAPPSETVSQ